MGSCASKAERPAARTSKHGRRSRSSSRSYADEDVERVQLDESTFAANEVLLDKTWIGETPFARCARQLSVFAGRASLQCLPGVVDPGLGIDELRVLRDRAALLEAFPGPVPATGRRRGAGEPLTVSDVWYEIVRDDTATARESYVAHKRPRVPAFRSANAYAVVGRCARGRCGACSRAPAPRRRYAIISASAPFSSLVAALEAAPFPPDRACLYVDALCRSQWPEDGSDDPALEVRREAARRRQAIRRLGYAVIVLAPATADAALDDPWSIFEAFTASEEASSVIIHWPGNEAQPTVAIDAARRIRAQAAALDLKRACQLHPLRAYLGTPPHGARPAHATPRAVSAEDVAVGVAPTAEALSTRVALLVRAWLVGRLEATAATAAYRKDRKLLRELAALHREQRDPAACEQALRRGMVACEEELGESHLQTLRWANLLAIAYAHAGNLSGAMALHWRVLHGREQVLGWAHPRTVSAALHVAHVCGERGQLREAHGLFLHARVACEWRLRRAIGRKEGQRPRALHDDHLLIALHGLGAAQLALGQLREAERTLSIAVRARTEVLGANHFATVQSTWLLAQAMDARHRLREAKEHYSKCLVGQKTLTTAGQSNLLPRLPVVRKLAFVIERLHPGSSEALELRKEVESLEEHDTAFRAPGSTIIATAAGSGGGEVYLLLGPNATDLHRPEARYDTDDEEDEDNDFGDGGPPLVRSRPLPSPVAGR